MARSWAPALSAMDGAARSISIACANMWRSWLACAESRLVLADILVPDRRIGRDVISQQFDALGRGQIDHRHTVFAQPVDTALEVDRFADNHGADIELAD